MKTRAPKVSKPFQPPPEGRREIVLAGYVTPSLNTMLGRNNWILTKLKATFADLSRSVHDKLQEKDDPQKMAWNGVSDTIRRFVFGIYDRDKIPVYIVHAVQEIDDPKWNAFFTQRLIVKHNHHSVLRIIETHRARASIPELLDRQ